MSEDLRQRNTQAYAEAVRQRSVQQILLMKTKYEIPSSDEQERNVEKRNDDLSFYEKLILERHSAELSINDQREESINIRERLTNVPFERVPENICVSAMMLAQNGREVEVFFDGEKYFCSDQNVEVAQTSGGRMVRLQKADPSVIELLQKTSNEGIHLSEAKITYYAYEGRRRPFVIAHDCVYWCNMRFSVESEQFVEVVGESGLKIGLNAINTSPAEFEKMQAICQQFSIMNEPLETTVEASEVRSNATKVKKEENRAHTAESRRQKFEQEIAAYYAELKDQERQKEITRIERTSKTTVQAREKAVDRHARKVGAVEVEIKRHNQIVMRDEELQNEAKELRERLIEQQEHEKQERLNEKARRVQLLRRREAYKAEKKVEFSEQQQNDIALLETRDNNVREYERIRTKELLAKYKKV